MGAKSFFGGRVTVKTLLVTDQPATRPELCARISSPRGELAVLTEGAIPIRHLAYVELRPAMLRGNHYHQLRNEYLYLIAGEVTLHLGDLPTGETASHQMRAGDLAYISPGVAHTLNPISAGHAIEYAA